MKTNTHIEGLACAAAVEIADGDKRRIQLIPMGTFEARGHGRSYTLADADHARLVITASQDYAGSTDIVIDYDHQSVRAAATGGQAPASGWIDPNSLTIEADGIYGDVSWTAAAAAKIKAREYRYFSPYFGFEKATGRVTRIINGGLTNTPAIEELDAVAAAALIEGTPMKTIALALGLAATADEAAICAAIEALNTKAAAPAAERKALASAFGLAETASAEELLAAASAAKPDPAQFVPMSVMKEVQTQLKALQDAGIEGRAAASVADAMKAGKVTPAQKGWATDYAKKDPEGFEAYVAAAAVVVTPGKRDLGDNVDPAANDQLTAEEKAMCSAYGWDEAAFLAAKQEDAA